MTWILVDRKVFNPKVNRKVAKLNHPILPRDNLLQSSIATIANSYPKHSASVYTVYTNIFTHFLNSLWLYWLFMSCDQNGRSFMGVLTFTDLTSANTINFFWAKITAGLLANVNIEWYSMDRKATPLFFPPPLEIATCSAKSTQSPIKLRFEVRIVQNMLKNCRWRL